jgi:hypothetical protein
MPRIVLGYYFIVHLFGNAPICVSSVLERRKSKREGSGAMSLCQLRWGGRVGPKKDDNKKEWASLLIEIFFLFFNLFTGALPLYFNISFCIQYLYVNLGHRSPRVMSWGACVG